MSGLWGLIGPPLLSSKSTEWSGSSCFSAAVAENEPSSNIGVLSRLSRVRTLPSPRHRALDLVALGLCHLARPNMSEYHSQLSHGGASTQKSH